MKSHLKNKSKNKFKKQLEILSLRKNIPQSFGGSHLKSNPKTARPVVTKRAMHIVLKTHLERAECNFQREELKVQKKIKSICKKLAIRLYRGVVMQNHIHLIVRCRSRESLKHFLREIGSFLGMSFGRTKPLFRGRPFSRIIEWGKDFLGTYRYLELNYFEKNGISKTKGRQILEIAYRGLKLEVVKIRYGALSLEIS